MQQHDTKRRSLLTSPKHIWAFKLCGPTNTFEHILPLSHKQFSFRVFLNTDTDLFDIRIDELPHDESKTSLFICSSLTAMYIDSLLTRRSVEQSRFLSRAKEVTADVLYVAKEGLACIGMRRSTILATWRRRARRRRSNASKQSHALNKRVYQTQDENKAITHVLFVDIDGVLAGFPSLCDNPCKALFQKLYGFQHQYFSLSQHTFLEVEQQYIRECTTLAHFFTPHAVNLLIQFLLKFPQVDLVLSSNWRRPTWTRTVLQTVIGTAHPCVARRFIDCTPNFHEDGNNQQYHRILTKSEAILRWVQKYKPQNWCVIDDLRRLELELKPNFVWIDPCCLLQSTDMEHVCRVLALR